MYKRTGQENSEPLYVDIQELQAMTSLGRNTAAAIGKAAGAERRVGRRIIYSVERVKAYIESL